MHWGPDAPAGGGQLIRDSRSKAPVPPQLAAKRPPPCPGEMAAPVGCGSLGPALCLAHRPCQAGRICSRVLHAPWSGLSALRAPALALASSSSASDSCSCWTFLSLAGAWPLGSTDKADPVAQIRTSGRGRDLPRGLGGGWPPPPLATAARSSPGPRPRASAVDTRPRQSTSLR